MPADRPQTRAGPGLIAAIFDLDGVVTDTASVHREAWKEVFDAYLASRPRPAGEPFVAFGEEDYLRYVDGRPRFDGVRSFLASRGIELPEGRSEDGPGADTVVGLGLRKNRRYLELLRERPIPVYASTVALLERLAARGVRRAIVSSSRNCRQVLERAGLLGLFQARVDGVDIERERFPGKPQPDMFLRAAAALESAPARTAVFEDAVSGVTAGRRGGFGLVIGIDRGGNRDALRAAGADRVVNDLSELEERDIDEWFR